MAHAQVSADAQVIGGPKQVVQDILDSLDRDSILAEARDEIRARLSTRS
jgi:hypothetical protein